MTNEFLAFAPISAADVAVPAPLLADGSERAQLLAAGSERALLLPADPAGAQLLPADPARALLDEMMARVGVDGLVAAHADAGLLALVDQHAAAVRDALAHAGRAVDAEGLASYAKSIAAAADRMGRPVPQPGHAYASGPAWLAAEWHLLRLVAVCMIAESADLL
jgi:hypothetical protein